MASNSAPTASLEGLQCMQIWGGNTDIDNGVSLAGLDCWVYSRPYRGHDETPAAVGGGGGGGGDIHFVTSCATGRITRLVVADVSGHGAPVAEMATSLRRLMRKHSNHYDQRLFVRAVNERFNELSDPSALPNGMVFATAVFASYYAPTDEFSLCNAGHPRPLRYNAKRGRWEVLEVSSPDVDAAGKSAGHGSRVSKSPGAGPSNLPLGIIDDTAYDQRLFTLGQNDLVLIYTDSLVEVRAKPVDASIATGDPGNAGAAIGGEVSAGASASRSRTPMLGEAGLVEICQKLDPTRPDEFIESLIDRLAAFSGKGRDAFDDDVTVLLLKRNDLKPRASLALSMKGTLNIARGVADAITRRVPLSLPDISVRAILGTIVPSLNTPIGVHDDHDDAHRDSSESHDSQESAQASRSP